MPGQGCTHAELLVLDWIEFAVGKQRSLIVLVPILVLF